MFRWRGCVATPEVWRQRGKAAGTPPSTVIVQPVVAREGMRAAGDPGVCGRGVWGRGGAEGVVGVGAGAGRPSALVERGAAAGRATPHVEPDGGDVAVVGKVGPFEHGGDERSGVLPV